MQQVILDYRHPPPTNVSNSSQASCKSTSSLEQALSAAWVWPVNLRNPDPYGLITDERVRSCTPKPWMEANREFKLSRAIWPCSAATHNSRSVRRQLPPKLRVPPPLSLSLSLSLSSYGARVLAYPSSEGEGRRSSPVPSAPGSADLKPWNEWQYNSLKVSPARLGQATICRPRGTEVSMLYDMA